MENVVEPAVEVEAHYVFDVLPGPEQPAAVAHLRVPGDRPHLGVAQRLDEPAERSRLEDRVSIDHHDDGVLRRGDAPVERGRLAQIGLPDDEYTRKLEAFDELRGRVA
jgi:hypothetical protein